MTVLIITIAVLIGVIVYLLHCNSQRVLERDAARRQVLEEKRFADAVCHAVVEHFAATDPALMLTAQFELANMTEADKQAQSAAFINRFGDLS